MYDIKKKKSIEGSFFVYYIILSLKTPRRRERVITRERVRIRSLIIVVKVEADV